VKESEFKINKDDNGAYSEMTSQLNREKTDKEVYRSVKQTDASMRGSVEIPGTVESNQNYWIPERGVYEDVSV
jgi:hypothetical protein